MRAPFVSRCLLPRRLSPPLQEYDTSRFAHLMLCFLRHDEPRFDAVCRALMRALFEWRFERESAAC